MLKNKKLTSSQLIILSFIVLISTGTVLLTLPIASRSGQWTNPLSALFTATSASCVTGLIVVDTATYWSLFGQFVILCMVQLGGMGVITMAMLLAIAAGKRIGLFERQVMQDSASFDNVGGVVRETKFIFKSIVLFESLGAAMLSFVFVPEYGFWRGLWYSIFHSVSAFCNAGFDLMGIKTESSSLTNYQGNTLINIVIPVLILIGGLGFATWEDIWENKHNLKKYSIQSRVILQSTVVLIALPMMFFYFYEFSGAPWEGMSGRERVLASFFQTVTPRTAGFNTVDLTLMSEVAIFIMIILMLIGGASGSTAGGMKIGTIAVIFAAMFSVFNHKADVNIQKRRLAEEIIRKAIAIFAMYIALFLIGSLSISIIESLPLLPCMFEAASAVATVGLTLGITSTLSITSKIILILLMFCGRVGGLTIIFAAGNMKNNISLKYPEGKITVG